MLLGGGQRAVCPLAVLGIGLVVTVLYPLFDGWADVRPGRRALIQGVGVRQVPRPVQEVVPLPVVGVARRLEEVLHPAHISSVDRFLELATKVGAPEVCGLGVVGRRVVVCLLPGAGDETKHVL